MDGLRKLLGSGIMLGLSLIASPASSVHASVTDGASITASAGTLARMSPDALPDEVRRAALMHLEAVGAAIDARWSDAMLGGIRPINQRGIRGVAYYDIEVLVNGAPAGFMIATNGAHAKPIVRFSTTAESPTEQVAREAEAKGAVSARFVKADVHYGAFAAGKLVASTLEDGDDEGRRWRRLESAARKGARADARRAKAADSDPSVRAAIAPPTAAGTRCSTPTRTGGDGTTAPAWQISSPAYDQLEPGEAPNPSTFCASGCGPTAWAILIGWIDRQASTDPAWYDYRGIVREGGVASPTARNAVAPSSFNDVAKRIVADIRNDVPTACQATRGSSTDVYAMGHIGKYLERLGMYGPLEHWTYHIGGGSSGWVGDRVEQMICEHKTPAIVGIGYSSHYVVAHQTWRDASGQLWIWANYGWGDSSGEWTSDVTFFAGTLLKKYRPTYPADFDPVPPPPPTWGITKQLTVPADQPWVDTGIDVYAGSELSIAAAGTWFNTEWSGVGPDGFRGYRHPGTTLGSADLATLIGSVGGVPFPVGAARTFASPATGRLYLGMNDVPGTYGDNHGSLVVTVRFTSGAIAHVTVGAGDAWKNTNLTLGPGTPYVVRAQGRWSNAGAPTLGPEGYVGYRHPGTVLGNADLASLIGQIGSATFPIGASSWDGSAPQPGGVLYLGMNDVPGTYGDNQGELQVQVSYGWLIY